VPTGREAGAWNTKDFIAHVKEAVEEIQKKMQKIQKMKEEDLTMAHSRIFELLKECPDDALELNCLDFLNSDELLDGHNHFLGPVADYVSDNCDRREDFKWLVGALANSVGDDIRVQGVADDGFRNYMSWFFAEGDEKTAEAWIKFHPGFKHAYFQPKYERFQESVSNISLKEFMGDDTNYKLYRLKECFGEKFGFYTYQFGELEMLDDFIRGLSEDKETIYWLGGTVDYHY
jgi:hypothetical protein